MTDESKSTALKKANRVRSTAYPAISLAEAVECSEKLLLAHPKAGFDRESAAIAIGYEKITGTSAPKVAALVHFGLTERNKDVYKNSDLAMRIHNFETENEKKEALLEAFKSPKLFNSLMEEYSGRAIPSTLNSVLIRHHGISAKVADQVVQTFKESAEYAGIYQNGVLKSNPDGETKETKDEADTSVNHASGKVEFAKPKTEHQVSGMHSVPLSNGVIVSYPSAIAFNMQTNSSYIEALKGLEKVAKEAITEKNQ